MNFAGFSSLQPFPEEYMPISVEFDPLYENRGPPKSPYFKI